ncbi:MAG TPA: glycosyltransferase family 39 protein [Mycobacteriales bacterium]|nr:glycosyltransferase family 39 protein [Mycobacteriales bacterium]
MSQPTASVRASPARGDLSAPSWRLLLRPVGIYVASRVAVLLAFWLAVRLTPELPDTHVFLFWDSNLYVQLIEHPYLPDPADRGVYAFFPLFPLLAHGLSVGLDIGALEAGLAVGALAGVASAVALWCLCRRLLGTEVADRAVALYAFFPASFVLSALYAEGVMIALSAACLWALVSRQWLLAGVLAALGTASRPNAVALIAACVWASGAALWTRREWRSLVAPALAPLGILGFFALLRVRTGSWRTWFDIERDLWQEKFTLTAMRDHWNYFWGAPFANTNTTVVMIGAVLCILGLVLLVRARLPAVLTVYCVVVIALAACSQTLGPRPRFVMTAFPLFFVFALHLPRSAFSAVLGLSATLLGGLALMTVSTLLFTP